MRDIRVDGIFQRVFILKEDAERIVYIPIKLLHRTDYERLKMVEKAAGRGDMLEEMRKTKLDNGKNALVLYDSLIQVFEIKSTKGVATGERLRKPDEPAVKTEKVHVISEKESNEAPRRKPGRPPNSKNKPKPASQDTMGSVE